MRGMPPPDGPRGASRGSEIECHNCIWRFRDRAARRWLALGVGSRSDGRDLSRGGQYPASQGRPKSDRSAGGCAWFTGVRERFLREARAAAALRHSNVAAIYQFGASPNGTRCFYAMELVEGETL